MYNIFKIYKLSKIIWNREEMYNHYQEEGITAADVAVQLNSEFEFPSNIKTVMHYRSTLRGRDVMWGRKDKSLEYQQEVIIPKLADLDSLKALGPNTVGGHYHHLIKKWSFEELWNRRFQASTDTFAAEVRSNISRHIFLCHDFQHVLFRYDTTQMGEACVQAITHVMCKHFGPYYAGMMITLRQCYKYKSLEPLRIYQEALRLAREVNEEFWYVNPLEVIELDVQEARQKYNIGTPWRYLRFVKEHRDDFRLDSIHPEYNDMAFSTEGIVL